MDKAKFIMLVGLPASGKSTKAKELAEEYNAVVISSDALRAELWGDEGTQGDNNEIFTELYRRAHEALKNGTNVIIDATNVSAKRRMSALSNFKKYHSICVYFSTPFNVCNRRNTIRERRVPYEILKRMYVTLQVPMYQEGWDEIRVIHCEGAFAPLYETMKYSLDKALTETQDYGKTFPIFCDHPSFSGIYDLPHDSTYHTLSVSRHSYYVYYNASEDGADKYVKLAGFLHDTGKYACKNFKEGSRYANFIGHENVSGQLSVQFLHDMGYSDGEALFVASICTMHMRLLQNRDSVKANERLRDYVGEELYAILQRFRTYDEGAK